MQIRCPHCHQPIELVNDDPSGDMTCESCGSGFNLASDLETAGDDGTHARTLGHFELQHCLGQGAFGSVWKARDTELDRTVAVKIPRADRMSSDDAEKFLREARAAAQVRHPNIVSVHEVGREEGQIYIASDFIEGASLDEWIEAQPLTVRETVELCKKIAEALHQAHEAGVVHRDLKPQNILMDMSGEPHVTDFGLAKRDAGEVTMTVEGAILGTPAYMPPEQARGEAHNADRRSDVYSLGVILFRLLTGELPFRGRSQMLIVQILKDEPPSLRKLDARLPRDVETICLKCLQKNPDQRYQTTADLATDLGHWLVGEPITARPISAVERSWRWCRRKPALAGVWIVATLLLLTLGVGGVFFAIQQSNIATQQAKNAARQKELRGKADDQRIIAEKNQTLADQRLYCSEMNLVQLNWEANHVGLVHDLLNRYRPAPDAKPGKADLRGFEWFYWDRLCNRDLLTLKGHTDVVSSVAFSPDGTLIATASNDMTVKLWDAVTGSETATLKGHTGRIFGVAFSPDGTRIATASRDMTAKLWDAVTGSETATLKGHTGWVSSVAFSPNGSRLATASNDKTLKVWDVEKGQETATLRGHTNDVTNVAFSPDGMLIASASYDMTAKLWDAVTGNKTATLKGHTGPVSSVAFSPNRSWLVTASGNTLKVWDMETVKETAILRGHTWPVFDSVFSPNSEQIASAGADNTVRLWDVATGQEIATQKGHASIVTSVVFSPDGTRIASASHDKTVKVWDVVISPESITLAGHTREVQRIAFSPDGSRVTSASADKTVRQWDVVTGEELASQSLHVFGAGFSPDGARLASTSKAASRLWNLETGEETATLETHSGWLNCVAFSSDGSVATAGQDNTVRLFEAATGQTLATLKGHTDDVTCVAFSPDGARIASTSQDKTLRVWDIANKREAATLIGHSRPVWGVAFSPDGTLIASASDDMTVKLWDVYTGKEVRTLKGHTQGVMSVAFSPDGSRLASAGEDNTVKLWNVATGQETITLKGHAFAVFDVAFSPDGFWLASASWDKSVKLWDARPWSSGLRAESRARRYLKVHRDRVNSLEELQAVIRADKTIDEIVRKQALAWAELFWKNRQTVAP